MTVAAVETARVPVQSPEREPLSLWDFLEGTDLRPVVVGVSKDPNAKVTLILVSASSGHPALVAKVPTSRKAALAVEREIQMLDAIRQRLPDRLRETVPRPIRTVEFDGRPVLVATALSGTPMTVSYFAPRHTANRSRVAADLHAAGSWLGHMQQATAAEHATIDIVSGLAERLRSRFGMDDHLGDVADRLAELDARLRSAKTPRTVVHGDFWFGNVLMQGGALSGVVDWEAGSLCGEPAKDLARFALSYALYLDRRTRSGRPVKGHAGLRAERWGAAVEFAFVGSGWFPEEFKRFLEDGLIRLGASPSLWREIALAGIAEVAAQSDDEEFARHHLDLFRRIASRQPREGT